MRYRTAAGSETTRRRSLRALALAGIACLAACSGLHASSISVGGPAPVDPFGSPAVASDGSLWYAHGHQLVRLGPDRRTRSFPLAPALAPSSAYVESVHLAPSTAGTVWFVAVFEWQLGQTPGSSAAGFIGRAGPTGMLTRGRISGTDAIARGDVLVAGASDGALWMQERRQSATGPVTFSSDGLVRIGADGTARHFDTAPAESGAFITDIVAGQAATVWAVQRQPSQPSWAVLHLGPAGLLSTSAVPDSPAIVPRGDGSLGIAVRAADRDVCVTGSISAAGDVHVDNAHPVIDDHRGQVYDGSFGCFMTAAGADGSVWAYETPVIGPHGTNMLPDPPWYVFRVRPDGRRDRWALPSHDYVAAMAPGPNNAMWFVSGQRHRLGVITSAGDVSEGVVDLPAVAAGSPGNQGATHLLPTGGTTLYLMTHGDRAVRVITVPAH